MLFDHCFLVRKKCKLKTEESRGTLFQPNPRIVNTDWTNTRDSIWGSNFLFQIPNLFYFFYFSVHPFQSSVLLKTFLTPSNFNSTTAPFANLVLFSFSVTTFLRRRSQRALPHHPLLSANVQVLLWYPFGMPCWSLICFLSSSFFNLLWPHYHSHLQFATTLL